MLSSLEGAKWERIPEVAALLVKAGADVYKPDLAW